MTLRRTARGAVFLLLVALVVACLGAAAPSRASDSPAPDSPVTARSGPAAQRAQAAPSPKRVLKHNRIYKGKRLKDRTCVRAQVPFDTAANITAYYNALKPCLDKAWKKKVKKVGLRWRKPRMVVWQQAVTTPCGAGTIYVSFYCPDNRTMYLSVEEMQSWGKNPGKDGLGGRLGWLRAAFVLGHEYGHHIQTLMGVWKAIGRQVYAGKTTWAAQESTYELQASCFSMAFLRSVRASYPIEDAVLADTRWRVIHLASHGTDANQLSWMARGWATGKPKSCNVFKAPAGSRA